MRRKTLLATTATVMPRRNSDSDSDHEEHHKGHFNRIIQLLYSILASIQALAGRSAAVDTSAILALFTPGGAALTAITNSVVTGSATGIFSTANIAPGCQTVMKDFLPVSFLNQAYAEGLIDSGATLSYTSTPGNYSLTLEFLTSAKAEIKICNTSGVTIPTGVIFTPIV